MLTVVAHSWAQALSHQTPASAARSGKRGAPHQRSSRSRAPAVPRRFPPITCFIFAPRASWWGIWPAVLDIQLGPVHRWWESPARACEDFERKFSISESVLCVHVCDTVTFTNVVHQ
jgi:hypothetical protein